jgi:hypothetical protein
MYNFPTVALAVSQSNEYVEGKAYDAPAGWHWATRAEVEAVPGWRRCPHHNLGGWTDYVWEGVDRKGFRFRPDSGGWAVDTTACIHVGCSEGQVQMSTQPGATPVGYTEFAGVVCVQD